jgi:hypothetical protein
VDVGWVGENRECATLP